MADQGDPLARIAAALERMAPARPAPADWRAHAAYLWHPTGTMGVAQIDAVPLARLQGIDRQREAVTANVARLARGHAAHDMLLWGSRGMGKSALVRASVAHEQAERPGAIALVQLAPDALPELPALFEQLRTQDRRFLVFLDDIGFTPGDAVTPHMLRSWLDGGVQARPENVRLAVTANRRAIVNRDSAEQDDPLSPRDAMDDALALADRFGLSIGFHAASQADYLAIVNAHATALGLAWDEAEALEWAKRRGARSGRTAWQFVTELAGRAAMEGKRG